MAGDIGAVAKAIEKGFELLTNFLSGKEIRRLRYQLEAAQNYIFVDEGSGQFSGLNEQDRKERKIHYRKQVFDSA